MNFNVVSGALLRARAELIDFKLFGDTKHDEVGECQDGKCGAVDRVVQCLKYWSVITKILDDPMAAKQALTAFCDEHYGQDAVLRDHIHFLDKHSDPNSVREIAGRFQMDCDGVGQCRGTLRHFRGRGGLKQDVEAEKATNFYVETVDSLHFYLFHLEEMGLRVPIELIESALKRVDEEKDEESLVDEGAKVMVKQIAAKKKAVRVDRFDGNNNVKFNVATTSKIGGGDMTKGK